ncbi:alpha/beta fold hydrolase [Brachybacterium sp. P6-10-X1]|uniref:alpha/beta fold hydrolase n=1 Tax=Brachybacterium sp. P6-10-X1 TaxID=1903186 RepID=UPI0009763794|nr:alpha/beta fold hydrolase [Brachybacterium sp. P6-10-X1]
MTELSWTINTDNRGALSIGTGPPLMLAHGAGGGVKGNFAALATHLASSRHLLGLDYPGSGNRPLSDRRLILESLADELVAVGSSAGFSSFPIVGLSLGAAVAVTAASRHPERVSALVLTAGFSRADAQLLDNIALFEALGSSPDPTARARLIFQSCFAPDMMNDLSRHKHEQIVDAMAGTIPSGASAQYRLSMDLDISTVVESLRIPVLVIVAGQDRMVLPSTSRHLADLIEGAELRDYENAGHAFAGTEVEEWARDIGGFLARHRL